MKASLTTLKYKQLVKMMYGRAENSATDFFFKPMPSIDHALNDVVNTHHYVRYVHC